MPIMIILMLYVILLLPTPLQAKSFIQEVLALPTTEAAIASYQQGSEQGDIVAITNLGIAYASGRGVEKNPDKASALFTQAVSQNEPRAAYALGLFYNQGIARPIDYAKAASLFQMAAEQGYVEAQIDLGTKYLRGEGLAQDTSLALKWLHLAAEQQSVKASLFLGDIYSNDDSPVQNLPEAVKWYGWAAQQGNDEAQMLVGNILFFGAEGVMADKQAGIVWLQKSAKQNFVPAEVMLGWVYSQDKDVSGLARDCKSAVKWLKKAAAKGHPKAIEWLQQIKTKAGRCDNLTLKADS